MLKKKNQKDSNQSFRGFLFGDVNETIVRKNNCKGKLKIPMIEIFGSFDCRTVCSFYILLKMDELSD